MTNNLRQNFFFIYDQLNIKTEKAVIKKTV